LRILGFCRGLRLNWLIVGMRYWSFRLCLQIHSSSIKDKTNTAARSRFKNVPSYNPWSAFAYCDALPHNGVVSRTYGPAQIRLDQIIKHVSDVFLSSCHSV